MQESITQPFTYNLARSGSITAGICIAVLFETAALHIVLWNYWWVAWPVTLMNLQLLYWFYSDYRAMAEKTIQLSADMLRIEFGKRWSAQIPVAEIQAVQLLTWRNIPEHSMGYVNIAGFSDPNLLVRFLKPVQLAGPFGIKRSANRIGLAIDEPERFEKSLSELLHVPT